MESRLAKRTGVKRKKKAESRAKGTKQRGSEPARTRKTPTCEQALHPDDEKGAVVERKREEIYMHDADGEETQGIHRRVQSGRERQEKRAGHCNWIQEPVVMVALRRQCRIMTNNYSSIEQPAEEARTQWGEDVRPLRKRKINQWFKKRRLTPPLYAYGCKCWKHGCNVMSGLVYNYARFRVRQWIFNVVAVATLDR